MDEREILQPTDGHQHSGLTGTANLSRLRKRRKTWEQKPRHMGVPNVRHRCRLLASWVSATASSVTGRASAERPSSENMTPKLFRQSARPGQ